VGQRSINLPKTSGGDIVGDLETELSLMDLLGDSNAVTSLPIDYHSTKAIHSALNDVRHSIGLESVPAT
jgi:hypothetical protein